MILTIYLLIITFALSASIATNAMFSDNYITAIIAGVIGALSHYSILAIASALSLIRHMILPINNATVVVLFFLTAYHIQYVKMN